MWPFNPKPKTQLNLKITSKPASKLRLAEFRADPEMAKGASEILNNPMFQVMLQVCKNEHPALISLNTYAPLDSRALHQARIEGYNMMIRNFEAMAEHSALPEPLEATFGAEERQ